MSVAVHVSTRGLSIGSNPFRIFNGFFGDRQISRYWTDAAPSLTIGTLGRPDLGPTAVAWYTAAAADLADIGSAAADEGYEPPDPVAVDATARLLLKLARTTEIAPAVYPTSDREVAIHFQVGDNAVLVLCDGKGGGACFASMGARNRRARYDDANDLPDAFLREQLASLASR